MQFPQRRVRIALLLLPVLAKLAGCASMGDAAAIRSAQVDANTLDEGAAIRAADHNAAWPSSNWWRAYRDPQLNAWVTRALEGSPSLAVVAARVRAARAMSQSAHANLLPQIDGDLSLTRQHWPNNVYYGGGPLANDNTWNNRGSLSLSYHFDFWGEDQANYERALDVARATSADMRAARLELEANFVRTYIDLDMNFVLLDISNKTRERQHALASLARQRYNAGLGTQLDVSQAEASIPDYDRQIDALEEAIVVDQHQLAALAGQGPGAGEAIARPTLSLVEASGLPSVLPAELLGRRPDVVAARWMVTAQARGIEIAKARFYPNINLSASISSMAAAGPIGQFLKAASGGWSAGPALTLPIFEGGRLRAELGAATAGYDQAVEEYNRTVLNALKDVSDQMVRMRSLLSQQQDANRAVASNERTYRLANEGFRRGLTDYVNVLIAQNQWLSSQDTAARIQAARLMARASLVTSLGGSLEDDANADCENKK